MAKIKHIYETSPFYGKILPVDDLIKINGRCVHDLLDYMFFTQTEDGKIELTVRRGDEELCFSSVCEDGDLRIEFEQYLLDKERSCKNKCVFCFIDQMPKNMRKTLYFKDDDFRLSLLYGNYVTMTNVSDEELQRIVDLRVSPLNISIHTTNPQLRVQMMRNPNASKIMDILNTLRAADIQFRGQIVLCPGLNDGQELERTLSDLSEMYPQLSSVSVVPLGMTRFRDGLYPLTPFTQQTAQAAVQQVNRWGEKCLEKYGTRLFYVADELYQKAQLPLPGYEYYEDFEQYENGVGMVISFAQEFTDLVRTLKSSERSIRGTMVTGKAAEKLMEQCMKALNQKFPNLQCDIQVIRNDFFGPEITVTGLITGTDVIGQLQGKDLGEFLIVSSCMLRDDAFLDDVTVSDVEKALGVPVLVSNGSAEDLIGILLHQAGIELEESD